MDVLTDIAQLIIFDLIQVYELAMMPPSAPQCLTITPAGAVSFSSPLYSGGGNIQDYEVTLFMKYF